jgi:Polyketide cyclase / dehydrase and lipid transport
MQIITAAERTIDAPPEHVYRLIRDYHQHHPRFLPSQFRDFQVEVGGVGAGTIASFTMTVAGRTTAYRVRVGEPQPGRMLIESDPARRVLTTFTVDRAPGNRSNVRIHTRWCAYGLGRFVERLVGPALLRRVYRAELELLDRYARGGLPIAAVEAPRALPWASAR